MASRWVKLKDKYPPKPLEGDPKYVEQVAMTRAFYAGLTFAQLMAAFVDERKTKDEIDDALKAVNLRLEALGQLLLEQFEAQDLTSVKTAAGQTLFTNVEPYVGVFDRDAFESYVVEHQELDYLWSVHSQTLGSLVKSLLEEGRDDEVPPGLKIFLKSSVRLRKA